MVMINVILNYRGKVTTPSRCRGQVMERSGSLLCINKDVSVLPSPEAK